PFWLWLSTPQPDPQEPVCHRPDAPLSMGRSPRRPSVLSGVAARSGGVDPRPSPPGESFGPANGVPMADAGRRGGGDGEAGGDSDDERTGAHRPGWAPGPGDHPPEEKERAACPPAGLRDGQCVPADDLGTHRCRLLLAGVPAGRLGHRPGFPRLGLLPAAVPRGPDPPREGAAPLKPPACNAGGRWWGSPAAA